MFLERCRFGYFQSQVRCWEAGAGQNLGDLVRKVLLLQQVGRDVDAQAEVRIACDQVLGRAGCFLQNVVS